MTLLFKLGNGSSEALALRGTALTHRSINAYRWQVPNNYEMTG